MSAIPYLYQLQGTSYDQLNNTDFNVSVTDYEDNDMTKSQVESLEADGKTMFSYISIGEAEEYRDYWTDNDWSNNKPDFLLEANPDWPDNYNVEFWSPEWKQITMDRIDEIIDQGYSGAYLDIVDGYDVQQVRDAYNGDSTVEQEMIDFVTEISAHAKARDPDFQIIPQNATELLHDDQFLEAIDGVGVEDTWYDGNSKTDWTNDVLNNLSIATENDKFVLAIDYPTDSAKQQTFIDNAIEQGFIPFTSDRDLTGVIHDTNYSTLDNLPDNWDQNIGNTSSDTILGTDPNIGSGTDSDKDPDTGSDMDTDNTTLATTTPIDPNVITGLSIMASAVTLPTIFAMATYNIARDKFHHAIDNEEKSSHVDFIGGVAKSWAKAGAVSGLLLGTAAMLVLSTLIPIGPAVIAAVAITAGIAGAIGGGLSGNSRARKYAKENTPKDYHFNIHYKGLFDEQIQNNQYKDQSISTNESAVEKLENSRDNQNGFSR